MRNSRLLDWFTDSIIFVALVGSLAQALFISLYIPIPFYKTLPITLLFYVVLSILFIRLSITIPVSGAILFVIWLFKTPLPEDWFAKVAEFLEWAIYYPLGLAPFDEIFAEPFIFLIIGLFSLLLYIFTIRIRSLIVPLILGISLIGIEWSLGHTSIAPYIWIFAFSIILVMASKRYIKLSKAAQLPGRGLWLTWTIPFAIITIISAIIIIPTDTTTLKWDALENIVEDIREKRFQGSTFTQPRQPFRLASTGFTGPDGELGGPVKLNRDIVLEVIAPFPTYLRGSILNHYTGTSWKDTIEDNRYPLSDRDWPEYRSRAFDMNEVLWDNPDDLDSFVKEGL